MHLHQEVSLSLSLLLSSACMPGVVWHRLIRTACRRSDLYIPPWSSRVIVAPCLFDSANQKYVSSCLISAIFSEHHKCHPADRYFHTEVALRIHFPHRRQHGWTCPQPACFLCGPRSPTRVQVFVANAWICAQRATDRDLESSSARRKVNAWICT